MVTGLGSVMGWEPGWCPITVSGHRLEIYSQHLKLKPDSKVISKSFSPKMDSTSNSIPTWKTLLTRVLLQT